jgi:chromate transporter
VADGPPARRDRRVGEVARLFLTLGVIGFGGPAAHVALMRDEVVRRRQWLDDAEFLDIVGATNLIPGPNSTELAIHLGHRRAGWRGLLTAGVCFIAPAVIIVGVIAWLYQRYGTTPEFADLRYGILPVIIAIVAHALVGLGRVALVVPWKAVVAIAAFVAYLADAHELLILLAAGALGAAWSARDRLRPDRALAVLVPMVAAAADATRVSLWRLFLVFLEIGSVLYGSGYVLLAFLQRRLVDDLGWLTSQQVLDAITVGQVTPGPVFTTATFVGWQVAGVAGAAVATVGIFGPSFVFVAFLGRIVPWMRARTVARGFLDGLTVASLGLMAGVFVELVDTALVDWLTIVIAVIALMVLVRWRINSAWLVAAGVLIGLINVIA